MLVNILGLTLGFTGLIIVLLFLNEEESYNVSNPNVKEIYRVVHKMPDGDIWGNSTNVEGAKYQEDIQGIESFYLMEGWYEDTLIKIEEKEIYTKNISRGNSNFFDFFPFQIVDGNTDKFKEARNYIAISEKQANIFFGTQSAVGKSISFYNREFVVTTVFKIVGKHFYMPNIVIQFRKEPTGDWGSFNKSLFVILESQVHHVFFLWFSFSLLLSVRASQFATTDYRLPTTDYQLPTTVYRLPTIDY